MGNYLKLFATHSEYQTYAQSGNMIKPNVSYCEDNNEVHYNPWVETKLLCKYNVTSTSSATKLLNSYRNISEMEIDGVVQSSVDYRYTFDTTGEHTVKYILTDPTSTGGETFSRCNSLTSITIPSSVTSIGYDVFNGCSGLTSITIPDSVTSIDWGAFYNCSGLTSITIPNSVTSIGISAFDGCGGLTSITVESGNTVYDSRDSCNAIIETATNKLIRGCINTVIPNTVTSIGNSAFDSCSRLTSITIPSSVTSIGNSAFYNCSGLTSITIPNSVTSIGNNAFFNCSGLTSITSLATTAPTIQNGTFRSVKSNGTLTVPSGSSGYDVWMGTGNYYLGSYSWTKVEQ